jgi:flagellar biosynthesis GTPase FlhF
MEDEDIYNQYKCSEEQSQYVVKYLRENYNFDTGSEIYFRSVTYDRIMNMFTAEIVVNDDEDSDEVDDMDEIILPGHYCDDFYVFINGEIRHLHIKLSYYERVKEAGEEETEEQETGEQETGEQENRVNEQTSGEQETGEQENRVNEQTSGEQENRAQEPEEQETEEQETEEPEDPEDPEDPIQKEINKEIINTNIFTNVYKYVNDNEIINNILSHIFPNTYKTINNKNNENA